VVHFKIDGKINDWMVKEMQTTNRKKNYTDHKS
jgi:hypothetical protein